MATTQVKHFDDGGPTDPYSPDYIDPMSTYYGTTDTTVSGTVYPDGYGGYVDGNNNPVDASGKLISASNPYVPPADPNAPSALTSWLNGQFGSSLTGKQLASLGLVGAGGLAGALTNLNKQKITPVGYQGGIPKLVANRTMVTAPPPGHVPGSGGINYGGDVTYTPKGAAVPAIAATGVNPNPVDQINQVVPAAQGGLMGLAHGGSTGQYLQGSTDGMADKLPTSIDGKQPAALSHGEFVVPADVVSHLGNGNSDAGAKKLYSMMDKIRQARTGTKKQGKQINPDKFMPGGPVGYAEGGSVRHFATGDSVPVGTTGVNQTMASWTGDYVPNMLAQGEALANAPYQQYTGQLTAGPSDLQNQAFGTASNLQTPSAIGQAANTAGGIANTAQNMSYNPTQATNQFAAPTPYSGIQATSGTFGNEQAQQYMNPYLQQSLNPQLDEARRQSDITAQQNNAAMTKAGAFGGGRQAILTAENQRNLGTNLANITGQGYNTAYTNAMGQYNADQARNMQAQQANIGQQQFGAQQGMTGAQNAAQYGQAAQQANIGQQQFGANLGLQGLQLANQAAQTQGNLGATQNATDLANLNAQAGLGATQAGITQAGLTADQAAFAAARDNPYKMLQFQQSLLNGLPISATNYSQAGTSDLANLAGGATTVNTLLQTLGLSPTQTGAAPATTPAK